MGNKDAQISLFADCIYLSLHCTVSMCMIAQLLGVCLQATACRSLSAQCASPSISEI